NILVETDASGRPTVKLLDFGIARLLEGDPGDALTVTGQRPMTRPYAAPEQVRTGEISTATDVWALGVLLYQLLAGQRPFRADDQKGLETAILDAPPTLPSVAAARRDPTTTGTASGDPRRLRGDLDAVCLTALAKEPERRYATAAAFAADLRRFLDDLPVEARPPAASYRIKKFVARHRAAVGISVVALALLVGGATFYTTRLADERDRAEEALAEAEEAADFLESVFVSADPFRSTRRDTLRLADLLDIAGQRVGEDLGDRPRLQGRLYTALGVSYSGQGRFEEADSLFTLAHALFGDEWTQARASALRDHGFLLMQFGGDRISEAAEHFRQIAAFYDREYGPDHHGTSGTLTSLAMTLMRMGEFGEADSTFREALRRYSARDTLDTTAYTVALSQHALLLNDRGRTEESLEKLQESLRLSEEHLGSTHPRVAVKH
ncbi:MAG: tetratricopeptide repeat-containing protein kinase family protein, partial [Bacteroidota bacterium]